MNSNITTGNNKSSNQCTAELRISCFFKYHKRGRRRKIVLAFSREGERRRRILGIAAQSYVHPRSKGGMETLAIFGGGGDRGGETSSEPYLSKTTYRGCFGVFYRERGGGGATLSCHSSVFNAYKGEEETIRSVARGGRKGGLDNPLA